MSILNHFGKVKTTFVPYKNKHSYEYGDKCQAQKLRRVFYNGEYSVDLQGQFRWAVDYNGTEKGVSIPGGIDSEQKQFIRNFYTKQVGICEHIVKDFAMVVSEIVKDITSPIWETVKMRPILNDTQLVCLKVDDIDGRVDHLEKMLAQVIEDNKLLQRKVDALEQQKKIKDLRSKRVVDLLD